MIKIYGPKENNFTSNGIVAFKPFKLVETKKISLNGWYIDVAAPLQYEEHLKQDMLCVVKVKSKLRPQAFRIKDVKKTQRKIEFKAEHVVFDARNYFLLDVRAVNMSAVGALKYINERTDNKSPFSFTSDVNNSSTAYFIRKNLLEAMVTIEERWGGYFEADNWSVVLKKSIGKDRGEVISYGKNLESIQVVEDWSNVVTKLYPVGFDGILLPEKYLESEIKYDQPYTKTVQFETEFEDEDRTEANLLPELRENAQAYIKKNQYPMVNYEVKSNINELMEIGDLIHVKHPLVDIQTTVQEYQYDILQNRVTSLVFGNYSRDVKKRFDAIKNDIKELKQNTSNVEAIIGNQTELINSLNKDGHIYIDDNQIMVLDKLPKENAKYVWRWNMGGLGFSENGIEGPFKQAWTIDGTFNTDFIAANSIMANQLHSDVGSSLDISSNESISLISEKNKEIEGELSNQAGRIDVAYDRIKLETTNRERDMVVVGNTINDIGQEVKEVEKSIQNTNASISMLGETVNINASKLEEHTQSIEGLEGEVASTKYLIKEQEAKINVESGRITQEVREREQSIRDVNDKINKINVIGPNLALGTDETIVLSPQYPGGINPNSKHTFKLIDDIEKSRPLTVSFSVETISGNTDEIEGYPIFMQFIVDNGLRSTTVNIKDGWIEYTLPRTIYSLGIKEIVVSNTDFYELVISKFKVEYGERRTEWQVSMDESFLVIAEHSTKIEQNSQNIVLEAKKTEQKINKLDGSKVGYNEVISSINMSPESIKIQAKNIDLRGYATFTDLSTAGSTSINGNNISTGTISASRINFNGARGRDVNLSGTISANRGNIGGFIIYDDRLASISKTHDFRIVLGGDSRQGDRWPIWMGKQSTNNPEYIVKPGGETYQNGEAYFGDNIQLVGELQTYATTALRGGLRHIVGGRAKDFISPLTNKGTRVYVNELTPDGLDNPIIGASSNRFNAIFLRNHPDVSSDPRLKRNISELPEEIIEGIGKLKPIQYTQGGSVHYGYNAQEVEYVLYQYCLNKYGWENAPLAMERYAFMHKDESYLSLLYGEIQVIKDKYYQDKIEDLQLQINQLTEVLNEIIK